MKKIAILCLFSLLIISISCKRNEDTSVKESPPEQPTTVTVSFKDTDCFDFADIQNIVITVDGGSIQNPTLIDYVNVEGKDVKKNNTAFETKLPEGDHITTVNVTFKNGTCSSCCTDKCAGEKDGRPIFRGSQVFPASDNKNETISVSLATCFNCCE